MNNTLVVTTYDEERYFLEIQIRSIAKYLSPCNLIYIYCDPNNNYTKWLNWFEENLKPLVPNFTVSTYNNFYFFDSSNYKGSWKNLAWSMKIFASSKVETDNYWDLDSKNFFFKEANLSSFKEVFPFDMAGSEWDPVLQRLHERFNITNTIFKSNVVPFKYITSISRELSSILDMNGVDIEIDNILYYQAYIHSKGYTVSPGECFANNSLVTYDFGKIYTVRQIYQIMKQRDSNITVTGIHKDICKNQLNKKEFDRLVCLVGGKELIPTSTPWVFN